MVELVEQVLLDPEVLDDRLEHEVAVGQLREVGHGPETGEGRAGIVFLELAAIDLFGERLRQLLARLVRAELRPRPQHHLEACSGGDLGHAGAHDPGTDDTDSLHCHGRMPLVVTGREWPTGPRATGAPNVTPR